jgi:hypothetical protein
MARVGGPNNACCAAGGAPSLRCSHLGIEPLGFSVVAKASAAATLNCLTKLKEGQ